MRRSSVITILLLVIVIVGLTVALVVTNLPKDKEESSNSTLVQESSNDNNGQLEEKEETPTYIALDSEMAKDMYKMLNDTNTTFFHYSKKGVLTKEDFSNEEKQIIAYYYSAKDKAEELADSEKADFRASKIQVKYMDEAMKRIFGDTEYNPTYGYFQSTAKSSNLHNLFEYDSSNNVYYVYEGFGGASSCSIYTAFTKVEEYSDRYEVTEKLLLGVANNGTEKIYSYFGNGTQYSDIVDNVKAADITSGTNSKSVVSYDSYSDDYTEKLISKYYDDATEYKHTFMKNADGTYYWLKTEIIK